MNNENKDGTMEKRAPHLNGMAVFIFNSALELAALGVTVVATSRMGEYPLRTPPELIAALIIGLVYTSVVGPILYGGIKIIRPQEALVLTLFGSYYGTLTGPGFFWVNPFATALNPASGDVSSGKTSSKSASKKISLKVMTLNNDKQKINDQLGNPIIIGIAVIWKVVNTAKAVFDVENYLEFLSIQCDSALRDIVRLYPYDGAGSDDDNEKTLRGSSAEVSKRLAEEIQNKAEIAGLEIIEARITHLSYAPEIAAAMLQRQQAAAVIAARQMIVDGAVSMVEMALNKLSDKNIVHLDEERKAAMVSNLLVVLCSNKDTQPVINSGSIY